MIGICCPPELDVVYREIEALAKVHGVEVERVTWPAAHYSGFLVSLWIDYDCPVSSRPPVEREEWAVFYLAKGLRRFQPSPDVSLEHVLAAGSGLPECFVCHQVLRDRASNWLVSKVCPGRPVDSNPLSAADERTSGPNPYPASIQRKKESS